jgi:hypothetical protein
MASSRLIKNNLIGFRRDRREAVFLFSADAKKSQYHAKKPHPNSL